MKNNMFHVKLIEEISNKIPQKNKMVNVLTNLLGIEKEAVYRRLRGEVPFSFNEVATISKQLSVSIDELVNLTSTNVSPFRMQLMEFNQPNSQDFQMMEQLASFINFINNPDTEACDSTNMLPKALLFRYDSLIRFYLFKWLYQYEETHKTKKYAEITILDEMRQYYKEYVMAAQKIGLTRYILDFRLFEYLANDLTYFHSINMITQEDIKKIKEDLFDLLNKFEKLTLTGQQPDTGNRVMVYISNLNFETSYSYVKTTTYHISFVKAFILNTVTSFDKKTYEKVRTWIQSQIKSSTLITESGEIDRIRFFEKQRKIVEAI